MSNLKTIRVLIAEDDYMVGKSTAAILRKMAYNVVGHAVNGQEAVDMTQSLRPDVVLMDIKMPIMDGIKATQHIYETCPTPVVALTAYATPEVIQQAIAAGIGAYLTKPATAQDIERAINITIARFHDMVELRRLNTELETEIAERKRAEAALQESEERYRDLVEKAGLAILVDDKEGNFQYFNETFAEWFGYSVEEMRQQSIRKLVYPDDLDRVMRFHTDRIQGREAPSRYELRGVGKDGSVRYLEVEAVEVKEGDNTIGTSSYLWDITQRKQSEQALRDSQERFLTVVDGIDADVYAADMDTYEILFMNEHMRDSFGQDLVGKVCWDVFRGGSGPCSHCTNDRLVDAAGHPAGVYVWEGQNPLTGNWYMNYDRAIKWVDGRLVRLQIATDITERKQAEEHIQQRNRELAALNALATAIMQSALDLDEVLQQTADSIVEGLGCNTALIFLLDERAEVFKGSAVSTRASILTKINALIGFPLLQIRIPARRDFNEAMKNLWDGRTTIRHDLYELVGPLLSKTVCSAMQRLIDSRTFFTMPLLAKGKTIGGIVASTRDELSERDTAKLTTFANQAAIAIENAQLYQETQQRALEQETLREAALALTTALDRNRVIGRILAQLQRVVPYDSASVQLLRENQMELVGGRGFPNLSDLLGTSFPADGDNPNSEVVRTRAPFIVDDAPTIYAGFRRGPHVQTTIRSWLGVPLLIGEQLVGMIALDKREPGFYTQEHARLAEAFAAQAAVAIENARLFEEERRRSIQLALINEVGEKAASILDSARLMQETTRSIQESFNHYNVTLSLLNEERRELVMQAIAGGFEHIVPGGYRQSIDQGIVGLVARTGKSWSANDVGKDPYYIKGFSEKTLTRSELCVPIKLGDKVIGVLDLGSVHLNDFDQADITAMEAVADRVAIGLENARLYEQAQRHSERLAQTLAVSELLHRDLELEQLLEQIAHGTVGMGFRRAAINVCQPGQEELVRVRALAGPEGPDREALAGVTYHWSDFQALMQQQFQISRSYLIRHGEVDWGRGFRGLIIASDRENHGPGYWHAEDMLLVPMWGSRGNPLGLLSVNEPLDGLLPDINTIQTLEAFANQAAIAIENARLFEETRQRALQLQAIEEVGRRISAILDPDELFSSVAKTIQQRFDYYHVDIFLVETDTGHAVFKASSDSAAEESWKKQGLRFKIGKEGLIGWAAHTGEPFLANDVSQEPRYLPDELLPEVKSELIVPLKMGERVVGVLDMSSHQLNAFDEDDLFVLQTLANQIAIAIENARLFEDTRRHHEEMAALNEIAMTVTKTLELRDVLETIQEKVLRLLNEKYVPAFALFNKEEQTFTLLSTNLQTPALTRTEELTGISLGEFSSPLSQLKPALRQALLAGKHYVTDDGSDILGPRVSNMLIRSAQRVMGVRRIVNLPLWTEGELVGSMILFSQKDNIRDEEIQLLSAIANQAAIAIKKIHLFEQLEERRVYLEGVLGAAPDAIVTLDAHHRIVEWNPGAERLFGYSQDEAIGQNLDHLVTNPDVFEEAVGFTQTAMRGGEIPPTESVRYRKDGSPVDVILAGSPILVGDELIGTVAAYTDITARKRMEETLRALALVDDLTNLYNRRGFITLGQQQLKASNRTKRRMVLLFADFDGLKRINDAFGHPEGDLALIEVANVLRETFRGSDIIARIAGDEFVILAIETDGVPAEFLTTRLQQNVEAHNAQGGRRYKLSLSVGLARYDPESPCSIDELLAQADRAMYEQKHDDILTKEAT